MPGAASSLIIWPTGRFSETGTSVSKLLNHISHKGGHFVPIKEALPSKPPPTVRPLAPGPSPPFQPSPKLSATPAFDWQTALCPQLCPLSRALAGPWGHSFLAASQWPCSFPTPFSSPMLFLCPRAVYTPHTYYCYIRHILSLCHSLGLQQSTFPPPTPCIILSDVHTEHKEHPKPQLLTFLILLEPSCLSIFFFIF